MQRLGSDAPSESLYRRSCGSDDGGTLGHHSPYWVRHVGARSLLHGVLWVKTLSSRSLDERRRRHWRRALLGGVIFRDPTQLVALLVMTGLGRLRIGWWSYHDGA
jgi:hypothetical protein